MSLVVLMFGFISSGTGEAERKRGRSVQAPFRVGRICHKFFIKIKYSRIGEFLAQETASLM